MSSILIACPHCNQSSSYPDYLSKGWTGTSSVQCKCCSKQFTVERDGRDGIKSVRK